YDDRSPVPEALDESGLAQVRDAFAAAARRADAAGVDLIEIHGAHGYLLHSFLSPLSNRRADSYGGGRDNRMRFPLEVAAAVRAAWPAAKPLGMRVTATDWVADVESWDIEDTVAFAKALAGIGIDYIDVSTGGASPRQKLSVAPGFQAPFAARVRAETGLPTMTVGLIFPPRQAEALLADGTADLIALGRGMLYDPRWPWHAARELGEDIAYPPQYRWATPNRWLDLFE
ncbi:MAG: oxidoreductase, partial [Alphaproteobacteria bacterium]|nr:oxidoreductase [Alphaproteobacteria bacterium]